jgi:hypothetical protein
VHYFIRIRVIRRATHISETRKFIVLDAVLEKKSGPRLQQTILENLNSALKLQLQRTLEFRNNLEVTSNFILYKKMVTAVK